MVMEEVVALRNAKHAESSQVEMIDNTILLIQLVVHNLFPLNRIRCSFDTRNETNISLVSLQI